MIDDEYNQSAPEPDFHSEEDNLSAESDFDSDQESEADESIENLDYYDMLDALVKKWMTIHLTHNVSLTATYEFWRVALNFFPKLKERKEKDEITRKTPQFSHLRRQLYKDMCPKVELDLIYLNTAAHETFNVNSNNTTPVSKFEQDPNYVKQCEIAHIKVCKP